MFSFGDNFTKFLKLFNHEKKILIIDPFCCMVRLAMMSFMPAGTKISILDNSIHFNKPNVLQGPIRWSQGDNRDDLHNIYKPILKSLVWYDISNDIIKQIFLLSCEGLNTLSLAYSNNSSISHSLILYRTKIMEAIENNDRKTEDEEAKDNIIYKSLKKLWNTNEIDMVNNMLKELKNNQKNGDEENVVSFLTALNCILETKERKVQLIIKKHTTLLE